MTVNDELSFNRLPDGLREFVDGVYVFDSCFSTEVLSDGSYQDFFHEIMSNLHVKAPESSLLAFNFREVETRSVFAQVLSEYDVTVLEYPRQYESCPLLPFSLIQNFLCESEKWLARGHGKAAILLHCERGGWPLLAFVLASFLIFTKSHSSESRALESVHREAPNGLLQLLSPLNPIPSQLRYLQYIASRNIAPVWPPPERALSLDCVIIRDIPSFDSQQGCRPLIRIFGRNSCTTSGLSTTMLYSMYSKKRPLRHYPQACEIIKVDIKCWMQGDVVLECVHLDLDPEREVMMFRVMFNTAFIRSNILILNSDDLDIPWEAKDHYPKGFQVELLFGDVENTSPTPLRIGDDTSGLPIEAFSRVHEIFSSVDWTENEDAVALWLLKQHCGQGDAKYKQNGSFYQNSPNSDLMSNTSSAVDSSDAIPKLHIPIYLAPESSVESHEFILHQQESGSPLIFPSDVLSPVAHVTFLPQLPPPPPPPPSFGSTGSKLQTQPPPPPPIQVYPTAKCAAQPPPPPPPPPLSKIPAPPPPPVLGRGTSSGPPPLGAKTSSAPPPPPLAGRGRASSGLGRGRGLTAPIFASKKAALKPLHWSKVTRAVKGSLWADTQKQDSQQRAPEIDISELESLYSQFSVDTTAKKNAGYQGSKPEKAQLVDLRRSHNSEKVLMKIEIPLPDLLGTVLALDSSALDIGQIENLITICPTKEEMEILRNYNGDKEMLGKCEQLLMELMKIPRVKAKLEIFSFKITFVAQVEDLKSSLDTINSAIKEVKESEKLRQIMQTILTLGNALNQGTARGDAVGFKLESLLKLSDTRATNNQMNLMHYLCKLVGEKTPEVLDFDEDLAHLEAASKIKHKTLAEEMHAVSKGMEMAEQELMTSENDGAISVGFRKGLKVFLDSAGAELRSLISLYSEVRRNADSLSHYFGEDPAHCPFEHVAKILTLFIKTFTKSLEENARRTRY